MQIAVLGAGMVGRAIALDLAKTFSVNSYDLNPVNLHELRKSNPDIRTHAVNLSDYSRYAEWLKDADLVVTAVPGFMGYKTLEAVISAGKNVADISFFPENALELDQLAKDKGVTVIADCGVAPGMSNLILGHHNAEMKISSFECYVGGLPVERKPPFQYKAPFSPVDVIQEYIRPARLMEKGKIVTKPALSDRELIDFRSLGELEAFNTDGLRTLIYTMSHIPEMKEKTLRYPGHIDLIIALQQAGFFDTTPLRFNQTEIAPLDFTSRILLSEWKLDPEEEEFTLMKIIIRNGKKVITWELYDEYDPVTKTSSMARTTGYTCAAAAHLIAEGLFRETGVFPPELVGNRRECFDYVMKYLKERRVNWVRSEE